MAEQANVNAGRHLVAIDMARYWNAVLIEAAAGKRHRFKMATHGGRFRPIGRSAPRSLSTDECRQHDRGVDT